jgi:hypothetical protein
MRILSRLLPLALVAAVLTACGSSGSSNSAPVPGVFPGGNPANACSPGTAVQLASPLPFQTGVSPNLSAVTIVASGNSNALYAAYSAWEVQLADQFGDLVPGAPLQLVSDSNGPHPFGSDFYYSSSLQGQFLTPGSTWEVFLFNNNDGCSLDLRQSFQT